MSTRPMADEVFAGMAADIELELMQIELSIDEEIDRRTATPACEEEPDGNAAA